MSHDKIAQAMLSDPGRFIMPYLGSEAVINGIELDALNPNRPDDKNIGSFRMNLQTGAWADFALPGVKGHGPIEYIVYATGKDATIILQQVERILDQDINQLVITTPQPEVITQPENIHKDIGLPPTPDRYGYPSAEYVYRGVIGSVLFVVRRYETDNGKEIRPWTYGPNGWEPKAYSEPRPLYKLDQLTAKPDALVVITEGEKAADAAARINPESVATTTPGGAEASGKADLSPLHKRHVVILPDHDAAGRQYAQALAVSLRGKVTELRVLNTNQLGWSEGDDVADYPDLTWADIEPHLIPAEQWLKTLGMDAPVMGDQDAMITRLAGLSLLAYEGERVNAAKNLNVRMSILDDVVAIQRNRLTSNAKTQEQALTGIEPEPWPDSVDGSNLGNEIAALFLRYVVLPEGSVTVLVLWVIHTYVVNQADFTPYINITSASKRSGKSTLLKLLLELVYRALKTDNVTPAALFRLIEAETPTLLIDEVDSFLSKSDDLRGILNSGFERSGGVLRVDGESLTVQRFATFCPKAIAGIGTLPGTISDRSIMIVMRRKHGNEMVEKLRNRVLKELTRPLQRKLARWATDNCHTLSNNVHIPEYMNDRQADIWEPLFVIARTLGGNWSTKLEEAAQTLTHAAETQEATDISLELLTDIREILTLHPNISAFSSEWVRYELAGLEGRPWEKFSNRAIISQIDVAKLLKPYNVHPEQTRVTSPEGKPKPNILLRSNQHGKQTIRCYRVECFIDPWSRYLPHVPHVPGVPGVLEDIETHICVSKNTQEIVDKIQPGDTHDVFKTMSSCVLSTSEISGTCGTTENHDETPPNPPSTPNPTPNPTRKLRTLKREGVVDALSDTFVTTLPTELPLSDLRGRTLVVPRDEGEAREALARLVNQSGSEPLGLDTETMARPEHATNHKAALSPLTGQMRLVQVANDTDVVVIDLIKISVVVLEMLETVPMVAHNALFDWGFLAAEGVHLKELADTLVLARWANPRGRHSLATCAEQWLGVPVDKTSQTSNWGATELTSHQIHYAAADAALVRDLHRVLVSKLLRDQPPSALNLVTACVIPLASAQVHGVLLDQLQHIALSKQWVMEREAARAELVNVLGHETNPESNHQLSKWLDKNLPPKVREVWPVSEKGKQLVTDKDTLEGFADQPLIKPLLSYRRAAHREKTWGETYKRHLSLDGRLHPGFVLMGAISGRMSCREPNIQNLPKDQKLRSCFVAPDGYLLVTADFSQIELRISAIMSQDPMMLGVYREGRDLHKGTVAQVTNRPEVEVTEAERRLGKALNFGFLYEAGANTFRKRAQLDYGLTFTLDEANTFKRQFNETYATLRWWQMEQYREAKHTGLVKTVTGRVIHLPNPDDCYTQARNLPIQGSAADLQMMAIRRVFYRLQNIPAVLVNFVHDELVLEVRDDAVEEVSGILTQEMTNAFLDLFKVYRGVEETTLKLVDIGIGQNYAEAK